MAAAQRVLVREDRGTNKAGCHEIAYDRRGFGRSDPGGRYDYDTLVGDLAGILDDLDLTDVMLVGFSMGGGELARYVARCGQEQLHSVVFAAAVPPFLLQSDDNPTARTPRTPPSSCGPGWRRTGTRLSRASPPRSSPPAAS